MADAEAPDGGAVIKVIGVGGSAGAAVNRMVEAGVTGVEFIAANADPEALLLSKTPVRIRLGRAAAHDNEQRLTEALAAADVVIIIVGESDRTGIAPMIARVVRDTAALSVAVVMKPTTVQGSRPRVTGNDDIGDLREFVDTLICVPNDQVVDVYGDGRPGDAFRPADDLVRQVVQGVSDLIQAPGDVHLYFADILAAMRQPGDAAMGIGIASGERRVEDAIQAAISSPLLGDTSIQGATRVVVHVTGGESLTLKEVMQAVQVAKEAVQPDGPLPPPVGEPKPVANWPGDAVLYRSTDTGVGDNILLGTALAPAMDETDEIRVTLVATGLTDRNRAG